MSYVTINKCIDLYNNPIFFRICCKLQLVTHNKMHVSLDSNLGKVQILEASRTALFSCLGMWLIHGKIYFILVPITKSFLKCKFKAVSTAEKNASGTLEEVWNMLWRSWNDPQWFLWKELFPTVKKATTSNLLLCCIIHTDSCWMDQESSCMTRIYYNN